MTDEERATGCITLSGTIPPHIDYALTRAAIITAFREARVEEREACAKIAKDFSAEAYAVKPFTSYAEGRGDAGAAIEAAILAHDTEAT